MTQTITVSPRTGVTIPVQRSTPEPQVGDVWSAVVDSVRPAVPEGRKLVVYCPGDMWMIPDPRVAPDHGAWLSGAEVSDLSPTDLVAARPGWRVGHEPAAGQSVRFHSSGQVWTRDGDAWVSGMFRVTWDRLLAERKPLFYA